MQTQSLIVLTIVVGFVVEVVGLLQGVLSLGHQTFTLAAMTMTCHLHSVATLLTCWCGNEGDAYVMFVLSRLLLRLGIVPPSPTHNPACGLP